VSVDRILALKLVTDVGNIDKQMAGVSGRFKGMAREAKSWGKAFATGLVIDGIGKVGDALGDAVEGYRSGARLAAQLSNTWRNLGLDGSKLDSVLKQVTDSTLALGTSDDEAVAAFNNSIKRTGDYEESLKRLGIAQDLVANGSASNLEAAFKLVDGAAKGSAKVVDKFGLTADTAAGRVDELGKKVEGAAEQGAKLDPMKRAMNRIGESMETIAGAAIVPLMEGLGKVVDEIVAPAIEDLAEGFADGDLAAQITAVAVAVGVLGAVMMAHPIVAFAVGVAALGLAVVETVKMFGDGSMRTAAVDTGLVIGEGLAEGFGNAEWKNAPVAVKTEMLDVVTDYVTGWFGDSLVPAFRRGWKDMADTVTAPFRQIQTAIQNIVGIVRDVWNSLDFAIPAFDFSWGAFDFDLGPLADLAGVQRHVGWGAGSVHVWDGTGDLIPDLGGSRGAGNRGGGKRQGRPGGRPGGSNGSGHAEGHKDGLDTVPFDEYPAMLHRNEAVLKAEDAAAWRRAGAGAGMAAAPITVNIYGPIDSVSAGRELDRVLTAYRKRSGGL
jgi:hypothetical protein